MMGERCLSVEAAAPCEEYVVACHVGIEVHVWRRTVLSPQRVTPVTVLSSALAITWDQGEPWLFHPAVACFA